MRTVIAAMFVAAVISPLAAGATESDHDTIIRNGLIYDGSGTAPYIGDVTIDGDRISYVGRRARGHGRTDVDAHGKAITPGFINMLAHPEGLREQPTATSIWSRVVKYQLVALVRIEGSEFISIRANYCY